MDLVQPFINYVAWARHNLFALYLVFFFFNVYSFIRLLWVLVGTCRIFSCGMWYLVPRPGIESRPPVLGTWSLSHWITREVPSPSCLQLQNNS